MQEVINEFLIEMGISPLLAMILGGLIVFLVMRIFGHVIDDFWSYCKDIRFDKEYFWQPSSPLKNEGELKDIKEHPKDIRWILETNSIDFENLVEGEEAFVQFLVKFIHTEKGVYPIYSKDYGNEYAETIFSVKDPVEFKRQAEAMITNIMQHEYFKQYIQEVYSIKRVRGDLIIELKLSGKPTTLMCTVPCSSHIGKHNKKSKVVQGTKGGC